MILKETCQGTSLLEETCNKVLQEIAIIILQFGMLFSNPLILSTARVFEDSAWLRTHSWGCGGWAEDGLRCGNTLHGTLG